MALIAMGDRLSPTDIALGILVLATLLGVTAYRTSRKIGEARSLRRKAAHLALSTMFVVLWLGIARVSSLIPTALADIYSGFDPLVRAATVKVWLLAWIAFGCVVASADWGVLAGSVGGIAGGVIGALTGLGTAPYWILAAVSLTPVPESGLPLDLAPMVWASLVIAIFAAIVGAILGAFVGALCGATWGTAAQLAKTWSLRRTHQRHRP